MTCDLNNNITYECKRYIIAFIDDYSRCHIYLINFKNKLYDKFKI